MTDTRTRSFIWSRIFVGGLVFCTAALTVAGIAAQYFQLGVAWDGALDMICAAAFAGIAGFALATSQMAAAMAQTLRGDPEYTTAFAFAVICAVICGLISVGGAHMGALVLGLDWRIVDLGGFALAFVKPAMSVVIEAARTKERQAAKKAAAEAAAAEAATAQANRLLDLQSAERRAAIAAGAPEAPPVPLAPAPINLKAEREKRAQGRGKAKPGPSKRQVATAIAAGAGAILGASAAAEPAAIVQSLHGEPAARTPSFEEVDRAIGELKARGAIVSERSLARHIGVRRIDIRRAKVLYGVQTLPPSGAAST